MEALIYRYRDLGHLLACVDPLMPPVTDHPLLALSAFKLTEADLDREFFTLRFSDTKRAPLRHILEVLKDTYCRSIGVEYMHIQDPAERRWLQERMEPVRNRPGLDREGKVRTLNKLQQAGLFEQFLHQKYLGQTRFSLEGAEAMIPMLDELFRHVARTGYREVILGMAHRGRLNVQTNLLMKAYEDVFCEFESSYDPESIIGAGDVKYHTGYLADVRTPEGHSLRVFLVNNPSHLEAVDPVVEGIARARQDILRSTHEDTRGETAGADDRNRVLPLLVHGDAAFAGQGVVAETLNMSQLEGYRTGGTIHLVINNQIGYTTLPEDARSTRYSTDVAKMLMVPIFHVHGEDPEAILHVTRLACDYRRTFGKDVVIDLICYRRYGHNEGDEPYFTQPRMYARIKERPPLHRLYGEKLLEEGAVSEEEVTRIEEGITHCLGAALTKARGNPHALPEAVHYEEWAGLRADFSHEPVETSVPQDELLRLAGELDALPEGFALHPKLRRLLKRRLEAVEGGEGIDWGNGEALAFASLLAGGVPIRLSGQDSRRGTFSHRHAVRVDTGTGRTFSPFDGVCGEGASFSANNSLLSEVGVLGFEYGYSLVRPRGLVLWEAQFGDFANNAQSVIDLFIASGESKWQRPSGLVLLLPHGFEGLGPEHSSARVERFLQLCADDNMQVCNPTTPAQFFHLLRRQVLRPFRKPLVVLSPKSLLRHPLAVSKLGELTSGTFREILEAPLDPSHPDDGPHTVLLCSGKIYYELLQRRDALEDTGTVLVRIEQLYPIPEAPLKRLVEKYALCGRWCWVQEEPENMGAWSFYRPHLERLAGKKVGYIGRKAAPSPATGFSNIFKREQAAILEAAL